MIAAIVFCVSIVALGQFGFCYWRAMIICVSALPLSDRLRGAARITATSVGSQDFTAILSANDMVPDLCGSGHSFQTIRAYYVVVEKLGRLIPWMAEWSEGEMTSCSRYAAVLLDQHLEHNFACAAQSRAM